jgi:hypothetical protein
MVLHTGDDHSQMNPEIIPISFGETVLREEKNSCCLVLRGIGAHFYCCFIVRIVKGCRVPNLV